MVYLNINDTLYPASFRQRIMDTEWDNRGSMAITVTMTHGEAAALFCNIQDKEGNMVTPDPTVTDYSEYEVAGSITDNRNGTVTVKMGKPADGEVLGILVGEQVSKDKALRLRAHIETAAQGLNDAVASQAAELFPGLTGEGYLVAAGTRINWRGTVKRAAVDLWDRPENDPDNAPTLWEDILYINGIRVIPEVITVGTAFGKGEQGWWQGELYTSRQDDNVWTPEAYPDGWEKVTGEEA